MARGAVLGQASLSGVQLLWVLLLGSEGGHLVFVRGTEREAATGRALRELLRFIFHSHEGIAPETLTQVPPMLVHLLI